MVSADPEHAIALYNPLLIAFFSRAPVEAELAKLRELIEQGRTEDVRGGMLFVVARKNMAGGIQPHVREFFEKMMRENDGRFGASAVVIQMQGFGASLMRGFITGLLLLTRKRRAIHIFSTVDEACRWLAPEHGLQPARLLEAYQQMTAKMAR